MRQSILTLHVLRGPLNRTLLRHKLAFYRRWYGAWQRRFVLRPLLLWVAETEPLSEALQALWQELWPAGPCLVAAQTDMARNQWLSWDGHAWQAQALFGDGHMRRGERIGASPAQQTDTRQAA